MDIVHSYLANTPRPEGLSDLREHREIPVHIHIPKCGGSFVRHTLFHLLRLYCLAVRGIPPVKQGAIIYIGGDDTIGKPPHLIAYCFFAPPDVKLTKTPDLADQKIFYRIPVEKFLELSKKGYLDVFSISATSLILGRKQTEEFNEIERAWDGEFTLRYFTTLRDPFERAKSLYYVQKNLRPHLACFSYEYACLREFEDFCMAHYSEPNWVSRFLAYLFKNDTGAEADGVMTNAIFDSLLTSMGRKVRVISMRNIGQGLQEVFSEVYSPYIGGLAAEIESQGPSECFNRTTKDINFKPEDLREACLNEFKSANSYDIALFQKYHERLDV